MSLSLNEIRLISYSSHSGEKSRWISGKDRLAEIIDHIHISYKEIENSLSEIGLMSICEPLLNEIPDNLDVLFIFFEGWLQIGNIPFTGLVPFIRLIKRDGFWFPSLSVEWRPTSFSWRPEYLCVVRAGLK